MKHLRVPSPANAATIALFLLLIGATVAASIAVKAHFDTLSSEAFEDTVEAVMDAISEDAEENLAELRAIQGLFNVSEDVTRSDFDAFVSAFFDIEHGTQALEWIPRILHTQRDAFIRSVQAEGFPDFTIHPPGDRDEYFPVNYVWPLNPNLPAFGFDLATERNRRAALERSRDTGELVATAPITLVQEMKEQAGLLIYAPIYDTGRVPATIADRRAELLGFGLAVFRVDDFIDDAVPAALHTDFNLEMFDAGQDGGKRIHVDDTAYPDLAEESAMTITRTLEFANRTYRLQFAAPRGFALGGITGNLWLLILVAGVLFSVVALGFSYLLLNGRRTALALAERITRSLAASEAERDQMFELSQELIITADREGRFVFVSGAARRILGRDPSEMMGKQYLDFVHPDDRERVREVSARIFQGGELTSFETRFLKADGGVAWIDWNAQQLPEPYGLILAVGRDVTDDRQSRQALEELRRRNELILDSAAEGIYGLNLQGNTTFVNPAAAEMIGWNAEEIIGKSQHAILHHSKPDGSPYPREQCPIYATFKDGLTHRVDGEVFWRRDGTSFPVHYTSAPIRDDQGNLAGAVVMFRDVTEELAVEQAKSDFVSMVSHELRSPLTSIRGRLDLLRDGAAGELTKEQKPMIEAAATSSLRLQSLIDDLLDLARIEAGTFQVTLQATDLAEVTRRAADSVSSEFRDKRIDLALELAGDLPPVSADPDRLTQVVTNVVSNAYRYTPDGGRVSISTGMDEGRVLLVVTDKGIGIDPDDLPRVFERFFQGSERVRRPPGSTGLGLAISKSLMELQGGEIRLESMVGEGTTITLVLNLAEDEATAGAAN